jgi:hypothetical protein
MNGYNNRIEFKGQSYIVQTQDKGPGSPYVESLIYRSGRLLTSKRAFYTAFLTSPDFPTILERMMEDQHNQILEEIVEGRFD